MESQQLWLWGWTAGRWEFWSGVSKRDDRRGRAGSGRTMAAEERETPAETDDALPAAADTRRRQLLAGVWVAASALCLLVLVASLPERHALLQREGAALARGTGSGSLISGSSFSLFVTACESLAALSFFIVAAVIFIRRRDDAVALFVSLVMVAFGAGVPETTFAVATGRPIWDVPAAPVQGPGWMLLLVFAYVFPDGRFTPRWTGPLTVGWAAWVICFFAFASDWAHFGGWAIAGMFAIWVGWFATGWLAQGYRFVRVSSAAQRQQTKWVVLGFAGSLAGVFVAVAYHITALTIGQAAFGGILARMGVTALLSLSALFFPTTIGVAVLRYRLWDIDHLINRALVYGALSTTLAAVYFGSVVVLQLGFRAVTGTESALAVAASTLGIVGLFQPLRRRIQVTIDRRFYRSRYAAGQTLEAFGTFLRQEVDLSRLTAHLADVVQETMQPASVSVWLRREGEEHATGAPAAHEE